MCVVLNTVGDLRCAVSFDRITQMLVVDTDQSPPLSKAKVWLCMHISISTLLMLNSVVSCIPSDVVVVVVGDDDDGICTKPPQSTSCQCDWFAEKSWECRQKKCFSGTDSFGWLSCLSNVYMPVNGYSNLISAELREWSFFWTHPLAALIDHCSQPKLQLSESVVYLGWGCSVLYMTLYWENSLAGQLYPVMKPH